MCQRTGNAPSRDTFIRHLAFHMGLPYVVTQPKQTPLPSPGFQLLSNSPLLVPHAIAILVCSSAVVLWSAIALLRNMHTLVSGGAATVHPCMLARRRQHPQ